jgi:hypothetical protein
MFTWTWIVFSALWIFGLALGLSQLGFAFWARETSGGKFADITSLQRKSLDLYPAAGLFCLGLAVTSGSVWERVFWAVLTGWCLFRLMRSIIIARKKKTYPN